MRNIVLFYFLTFLLVHTACGEIKIWGFKGIVTINDKPVVADNVFENGSILRINDSSGYVCLIDVSQNKLLELTTPEEYPFEVVQTSFSFQTTLPELSKLILTSNYLNVTGYVSCPPLEDFIIYPSSRGMIKTLGTDTITFQIVRNKRVKRKDFISISLVTLNIIEDTLFKTNLSINDHYEIVLDLSEFPKDEKHFLIFMKGVWLQENSKESKNKSGVKTYKMISRKISTTLAIEIINEGDIIDKRNKLNELKSKGGVAVKLYGALWAIHNNLIFEAIEILKSLALEEYEGFKKYPFIFSDFYNREGNN